MPSSVMRRFTAGGQGVGASDAAGLARTVNMSFALTNVSAEGLLLLAVDAAAVDALALRQLSHPACFAEAACAVELTALQVWLQRLDSPQVRARSSPLM